MPVVQVPALEGLGDRLATAVQLQLKAERDVGVLVQEARAAGWSWRRIAAAHGARTDVGLRLRWGGSEVRRAAGLNPAPRRDIA